jgi:hypothetical protein
MHFDSFCAWQCHRVAVRLLALGYVMARRRLVLERTERIPPTWRPFTLLVGKGQG